MILEASWTPSGDHAEAMLATKPSKKHLGKQSQKKTSKRMRGGSRVEMVGRSWGPLNEQKTTLSGNYRERKHALAASAVADKMK